MPQLLLEIFSEEIPARMQAQAARDLERMARDRLAEQGLLPAGLKTFSGPRRLTLVAEGLPPAQADRTEERKGPRVGAPDQAMDGFLRSTGLTRDQLVERDGVWFAQISRQGQPTPDIAAEMTGEIIRAFPWPKSMRWGTGSLRWVRPIQRILLTFDGEVVPFEIEGIASGELTEGHRFMGSGQPFRARTFDEYAAGLQRTYVVLDPDERKQRILEGARTLCFARNLELIEDQGLLDEVAGLSEWPVAILGDMDPSFLDLPPEVIRTSMRTHQKYFAVRDPKTGGLAPHFLAVANIEAADGGKAIANGNARVLSARLNDARFFWDEDRKVGFEPWLEKLKGVTFHAKLGTMAERVERIAALAREIAPLVGADPDKATEAARLAKADLASGMVGEFPELQGIMGGYYSSEARLETEIAEAVRDHYRPQGPNDDVPTAPVTITVALADKLDTLISFFGIDEKPTGSRDPFALRRAALGVIRSILSNNVRLPLSQVLPDRVRADLLAFFADRLKVLLRDQGKRPDLVDAVFALGDDDLVRIVARVDALAAFLDTDDGSNLLAGYKRATNILKAEEKKRPDEAASYAEAVGPHLLIEAEERALYEVIQLVLPKVEARLQAERFADAMADLASLRAPVDAFFDKVLVNAEDPEVRINRLRLLSQVRNAMGQVADFSQVSG
jgi:glycyl-tRNA synthetase beta chain